MRELHIMNLLELLQKYLMDRLRFLNAQGLQRDGLDLDGGLDG